MKTPYLRHEYPGPGMAGNRKDSCDGLNHCQVFSTASPPSTFGRSFLWYKLQQCDSFLQCVSKEERKILELALESFESVDKDDLKDVLDAHDCHYLASEDTMAGLMSQLGHKTLIQTPMFVIECWKPILKTLADTLYPQRLVEIMEERVPTPKHVKELMNIPEQMNALQNTVAIHLKWYIRPHYFEVIPLLLHRGRYAV